MILPSEWKKERIRNRYAILITLALVFLALLFSSITETLTYSTPKDTNEYAYAEVTAYSPRVQETDDDPLTMASGNRVYEGAVACPEFLELGTYVKIAGKIYKCEDRMNARYRNSHHYDIFMWNTEQALEFGRKPMLVTIIK